MKTPLVIVVQDYHFFEEYKTNFNINGTYMEYEEIGYGSPSIPSKAEGLTGYVAVFWAKGCKNQETLDTISQLKKDIPQE